MADTSKWWVVIATGPSLQRKDVDALRGVGTTIAVNCAVFYAPWSDVLYAADAVWWRHYGPKVDWFKGRRVSRTFHSRNIERWRGKGWKRTGGNSGHLAIQYAADHGAKNIAIYAFDQQLTGGQAHCHADHPRQVKGENTSLGNAHGVAAWPRAMNATAVDLKEREIRMVNLSRMTALRCFQQMTVERFLEEQQWA